MIVFLDLTGRIEGYGKVCAFLQTSCDTFLTNIDGQQLFKDREAIGLHKYHERLFSLLPEGFFDETTTTD